jgi:hypothetical protein
MQKKGIMMKIFNSPLVYVVMNLITLGWILYAIHGIKIGASALVFLFSLAIIFINSTVWIGLRLRKAASQPKAGSGGQALR